MYNSKDYGNCPKSGRTYEQYEKPNKLQKSFQIESMNKHKPQMSSIPLINSIEYKNYTKT